ncbi:MAG: hypothetical protein H7259_05375 [Cytophagales bacterium]|nr:hypothetical protein [Cytophaga sp.]
METNIIIEMLLLVLFVTSVINCQKRIRQGVSWAYHTSIVLSLVIGSASAFMLVLFSQTLNSVENGATYSALIFWSVIFSIAIYNLATLKKIRITDTEVIVSPLIGRNTTHNFCEAHHYSILKRKDYYYTWKELTIFFNSRKIKISSIQHEDFVDIHNHLVESGIPEDFGELAVIH